MEHVGFSPTRQASRAGVRGYGILLVAEVVSGRAWVLSAVVVSAMIVVMLSTFSRELCQVLRFSMSLPSTSCRAAYVADLFCFDCVCFDFFKSVFRVLFFFLFL